MNREAAVSLLDPSATSSRPRRLSAPLLLLLLAAAAFLGAPPSEAQTCTCEHFGSQSDGFCEAFPEQEYYYDDPSFPTYRYQWIPIGSTTFPDPPDPFSGYVVYSCPQGRICRVRLRLFYRWPPITPGGEEFVGESVCLFGTGGSN